MAVESTAISTERRTDGHSSRSRSMRSYHRVDSVGGGRLNTADVLIDTANVTTSGATSVSTTSTVTVHMTIVAARSTPITPRLPVSRQHRDLCFSGRA
jgi:hypothetical protein